MPQSPEKKSNSSFISFFKKSKEKVILISIIIVLGLFTLITLCTACIILTTFSEDNFANETINGSEVLGEQIQEAPKYKVLEITDGDTIKIDYNGTAEKVRFIGIDTPETNECFNSEANNKLKSLVENKYIEIEFDDTQGERDKYNRLLIYIWLDGELINKTMVAEGYAHEYTYNLPYKYQQEFKDAQREAQSARKGLWGDVCSCPKDTERSRECIGCKLAEVEYYNWDCSTYKEQVNDDSCTQGCTIYTPPSTTTTTIAPSPSYICDCSKTCPQMSSCEEAYFQLNNCGCSKRDGDHDGVPCESICPGG